jgi:hypothetical protein
MYLTAARRLFVKRPFHGSNKLSGILVPCSVTPLLTLLSCTIKNSAAVSRGLKNLEVRAAESGLSKGF